MTKVIRALFNLPEYIEVLGDEEGLLQYNPLQFAAYVHLNLPILILGEGDLEEEITMTLRKDPWRVLMLNEPPARTLYTKSEFEHFLKTTQDYRTPEDFAEWLQNQLPFCREILIETFTKFMLKSPQTSK